MKRIVRFFIIVALALLLALAGCAGNNGSSGGNGSDSGDGNNGNNGNNGSGNATTDIYEVVMQYPMFGSEPPDLQKVEDAINEKTERAIGVHVKFYPVRVSEMNSVTRLMIASGEKLDLMSSMFEGGIGNYANDGILLELDGLVEKYGDDIVRAEGKAMSGGYFDGKLYAVPTEEKMGRVEGFAARKDLLDKYGIEYDAAHVYTFDELTDIFSKVKAGEGDGFYCIAASPDDRNIFYYTDPVDFLGSSLASGCLTNYGADTDTVTNYFETPRFDEICATTRTWYDEGYYAPDCNTTVDAASVQMQGGERLGFFVSCEPDIIVNQSNLMQSTIGTELVPLYTAFPAAMTQYYQLTLWAIPVGCENPEKTMQWLNMMYADPDITNLLNYGIEGVHYTFAEGSDCVITYPTGVTANDSPYNPLLNVWGDKKKQYVMAPLDETYYKTLEDFNNSIDAGHTSRALGYCFNSKPVKTEFAAVGAVIDKYLTSLSLGVVNPENVIPEFKDELKDAGIDLVIAENQKQFDEWREGEK